jgi:hypothetical protein
VQALKKPYAISAESKIYEDGRLTDFQLEDINGGRKDSNYGLDSLKSV